MIFLKHLHVHTVPGNEITSKMLIQNMYQVYRRCHRTQYINGNYGINIPRTSSIKVTAIYVPPLGIEQTWQRLNLQRQFL